MLTYIVRSGEMFGPDGELLGVGYSGRPGDKNDPMKETLVRRGPIPRGRWIIQGPPRTTQAHGPYVLRLAPRSQAQTFGRGGFLIHGDSAKMPGSASEGCIILPRAARIAVWESGDRELRVVGEKGDL